MRHQTPIKTTQRRKAPLRGFVALLVISWLIAPGGEGFLSVAPAEDGVSVLKGLRAPASSERPWPVPDLRSYAGAQEGQREPEAEARKEYELAELIDLAERIHPETKVAWERAKQAASAVGLAQSQYYPVLALQAAANYGRAPAPLPLTPTQAGFMDVREQQATTGAALEWVLLDFGRRKADVAAATHQLLAANLGFNARHQEIVFKVQSAFYEFSKARGRLDVAQTSLASSIKVQEAAEERFKRGLATAPDVSQARQQAAQAAFDMEAVQVEERDAQVNLAEAVGILPTTPLRVVDFSKLPIPTNLESSVETFIDKSLEQRPDLLAKVATLRQKEAEIRRARAAYYPTLMLQGAGGGAFDRARVEVSDSMLPWASTQQPTWDVGVSLTWSLFDGGARRRKLEMAKSEREAAQHELRDSRDKAISQVWRYYSDTKLAIRRLDVAAALVEASQKSYDQTFESYRNGLSSLVDLLAARHALSQALYTQLDTRATTLESTAALAFASGDLGMQLLKRKPGTMSFEP
jgi:outer membrane protein TolC